MTIKVLGFGIVREIFGDQAIMAELPESSSIADLRIYLEDGYPKLARLASYMIACDDNYAQPTDLINDRQEIAVIPPVSGG